jgi:folate-binding protein YgfZ
MQARIAVLPDRGVVRVAGEDAEKLLQGVVTNDMDLLATRPAIHAALLTPQGKILFEFFVIKAGQAYLLETGADQAAGLAKRLAMYKLRAKATIEELSNISVAAVWGEEIPSLPDDFKEVVDDREDLHYFIHSPRAYKDPRLAELGERWLLPSAEMISASSRLQGVHQDQYHAHRIALGVPEAGKDYALGDTFPHEADFDRLNGVSFTKGCFVGQEVVSRMQHRAHVRKRVVPVEGSEELQPGAEITVGTAAIGKIGSVAGRRALAMLRLDRAAEAKLKGQPLAANAIEVMPQKPDWLAATDFEPTAAAETT